MFLIIMNYNYFTFFLCCQSKDTELVIAKYQRRLFVCCFGVMVGCDFVRVFSCWLFWLGLQIFI